MDRWPLVFGMLAGLHLGPAPAHSAPATAPMPAPALVALSTMDASIRQDVRYAGSNNFLGRPAAGYSDAICRLTPRAARALAKAQRALQVQGLGLMILDCFRPPAASRDFMRWVAEPGESTRGAFYPNLRKVELARKGYVAGTSKHSQGETVDVTLVDADGQELDLGTAFDFFDERSAHGAPGISADAAARRARLASAMQSAGFRAYKREWWHYTLAAPTLQ